MGCVFLVVGGDVSHSHSPSGLRFSVSYRRTNCAWVGTFEPSVQLQGVRFVQFTLASGFSLIPFSMVDDARAHEDEDYRLDCFAMIKAMVGQMARPSAAPSCGLSLADLNPHAGPKPVVKTCLT